MFLQGTFQNLQKEFNTELETLTNVEHRNLVKLIGFVDEDDESIIISEYVPNGTLREHLDGKIQSLLWKAFVA